MTTELHIIRFTHRKVEWTTCVTELSEVGKELARLTGKARYPADVFRWKQAYPNPHHGRGLIPHWQMLEHIAWPLS